MSILMANSYSNFIANMIPVINIILLMLTWLGCVFTVHSLAILWCVVSGSEWAVTSFVLLEKRQLHHFVFRCIQKQQQPNKKAEILHSPPPTSLQHLSPLQCNPETMNIKKREHFCKAWDPVRDVALYTLDWATRYHLLAILANMKPYLFFVAVS